MEELSSEKKKSFFENKVLQFFVRFLTGLAFGAFMTCQIVLLFQLENGKVGRGLGIACYFLITVASFFSISCEWIINVLRTILMCVGLTGLFVLRFINFFDLLDTLDSQNLPSVMDFLVYIFSQLGAVIIVVFLLAVRDKKRPKVEKILTIILMSVVIVLYVAAFVMDSILVIKYHYYIDLNRRFTLLLRALYCFAFVGTAVGFMLPAPIIEDDENNGKEGDFIYSENVEDEIDLII